MPTPDYQLDYLEKVLTSAQPKAWARWYATFQAAYEQWQLAVNTSALPETQS